MATCFQTSMHQRKRPGLIYRLICLFVALNMVNLGVAPSYTYDNGHYEMLTSSKTQSFGELLMHQLIGADTSLPNGADSEEESDINSLDTDYFLHHLFTVSLLPPSWRLASHHLPFQLAFVSSLLAEIIAPPPQYTV